MSASLHGSRARLLAGCILLVLAGLVVAFVLPDAAQQRLQKQKAAEAARRTLLVESERLAALEAEDQKLVRSRKQLDALLGSMPEQTVGGLQWALSRRLHDLALGNGVQLKSLKYGLPVREGTAGLDLEVLDVEFSATGIYQNLKPFMLGLEDARESRLPFAVAGARLEEGPEGATLSVVLRAFRRSAPAAPGREGP